MNGSRIAVLALVLLTALLLDTVVLGAVSVGGVGFEVITLTVVGVALQEGAEAGMRYGFAAGLMGDLLAGGLVGLSALVLLLVGFVVGLTRPYLTGSPLAIQLLVGGVSVAAAVLLYGGLSLLFDPGGLTISSVAQATVIAGLLNTPAAPLVIRPVAALCRRTAPLAAV